MPLRNYQQALDQSRKFSGLIVDLKGTRPGDLVFFYKVGGVFMAFTKLYPLPSLILKQFISVRLLHPIGRGITDICVTKSHLYSFPQSSLENLPEKPLDRSNKVC
jgi:hypothetical protein